jgi:hypothetical protein
MFLAGMFQAPRWAITEGEAERLSEGFARFARWYDFPEISDKIADHYVFAMALGVVYGTRLMAEINEARKAKAPPIVMPPSPGPQPTPANARHGETPDGDPREPPDPRNWRTIDVEGVQLDIPPVTGNIN